MPKHGPKGNTHGSSHNDDKVAKVLGEFKGGTLRSGSGAKVTGRDQAVAIERARKLRHERKDHEKGHEEE